MLDFRYGYDFIRTKGQTLRPGGRRFETLRPVKILGVDVPAEQGWDGGTGVMMRENSPLAWLFLWHDMLDIRRIGWVVPMDALFLLLWALTAVRLVLRGVALGVTVPLRLAVRIQLRAGAALREFLGGLWAVVGVVVYIPFFVMLYPARLAHRLIDNRAKMRFVHGMNVGALLATASIWGVVNLFLTP